MDSEKKHIIYTAEDIQKYLAGKLGPAEMHAMEKAALDDAFLAEAMEGYRGMEEKELDHQLTSLRNNFLKGQSPKVIEMKPASRFMQWKVAAAVLVVCGGLGVTYFLKTRESPQNESIAVVTKKNDQANSVVADSTGTVTNKAPASVTTKTKAKSAKPPAIPQADKEVLPDSSFLYRPGKVDKNESKSDAGGGYVDDQAAKRNEFATRNEAAPDLKNNAERPQSKSAIIPDNKVEPPVYPLKTDPEVRVKFNAQVVGQDGTPLPFAKIIVTKENIGTYTDASGNFRLISSDSLLNIEIKSVGYITGNFTLRSDLPQNKIVLAEDDLALREKTVVTRKVSAYGHSKKRRSILVRDTVLNVEPEDGWHNYDTYITNNLSLPDNFSQKKIHGEVGVSFEVRDDGAITNVKIDKSLCDDCDEAALRVIKEGPRWKVIKGSQGIGKVKVRF